MSQVSAGESNAVTKAFPLFSSPTDGNRCLRDRYLRRGKRRCDGHREHELGLLFVIRNLALLLHECKESHFPNPVELSLFLYHSFNDAVSTM